MDSDNKMAAVTAAAVVAPAAAADVQRMCNVSGEMSQLATLNLSQSELLELAKELLRYARFVYALTGFGMSVTVVGGVVCNLLCFLLFASRELWSSVNYYMLSLAVWDTVLLLFSWLLHSNRALAQSNPALQLLHSYPYSYALTNIAMWCCIWLTTAVALERYYAVCYPLRHRASDNAQRARLTVLVVSAVALVLGVPRLFELQVARKCAAPGNRWKLSIDTTAMYRNQLYYSVFHVAFGLLFESIGPLCLISVLTIKMLIEMRRAHTQRRQLAQIAGAHSNFNCHHHDAVVGGGSNNNTPSAATLLHYHHSEGDLSAIVKPAPSARMPLVHQWSNGSYQLQRGRQLHKEATKTQFTLTAVVVKFLICYTLPTAMDCIQYFVADDKLHTNLLYKYIVHISNYTIVLNSATNSLLYVLINRRFRRQFIDLLMWRISCFDLFATPSSRARRESNDGGNSGSVAKAFLSSSAANYERLRRMSASSFAGGSSSAGAKRKNTASSLLNAGAKYYRRASAASLLTDYAFYNKCSGNLKRKSTTSTQVSDE